MFEILTLIIALLANRLTLNSTNSSKPPQSDPNRKKRKLSALRQKNRDQKGKEVELKDQKPETCWNG